MLSLLPLSTTYQPGMVGAQLLVSPVAMMEQLQWLVAGADSPMRPPVLYAAVCNCCCSCPCVHENFYSNQRWCCGDSAHIDIGRAAFKKVSTLRHSQAGIVCQIIIC